MRRFRSSRGRRPRAPVHWHRERNTGSLTSTTTTDVNLLEVTDYSGNTALSPSGVTLVRTIFTLAFIPVPPTLGNTANIDWALWVLDREDVGQNPATSQNLIDERVLDHGVLTMSVGGLTADNITYFAAPLVVDCKQKVRLQDSEVRLTLRAVHGFTTLTYYVHSSVLVRGDTT